MPEAQYKYMELDQGDCVVPLKIRRGALLCCIAHKLFYYAYKCNVFCSGDLTIELLSS